MHFKTTSVNDPGSERAVLSGICQFGKDAYVDVSDIISTSSFTIENNQAIYKCLSEIFQESDHIDLASIIAKANQLNLTYLVSKKSEDVDYLRALFNFPIKLENVRVHAKRIAKIEVIRKAQQKHIEAYQQLNELDGSESIDKILGTSEKPVFELITELSTQKDNSPSLFSDGIDEYISLIENHKSPNIGITSPFPSWDSAIGTMRRGNVTMVGARAKVGKSNFCQTVALHTASKLGVKTLYLDSEMLKIDQTSRLLSNISGIHISKIETGQLNIEERSELKKAGNLIKNIPLFHKSIAGYSYQDILSTIRRWVYKDVGYNKEGKTNPSLIILDYFKLMSTDDLDSMPEYQSLGYAISNLVDLMKTLDTVCLATIQLNREGVNKDGGEVISGSDRILWLVSSFSILRKLEPEEMIELGKNSGNMKLKPIDCRYGPGVNYEDYISIQSDGGYFRMKEIGLRSTIVQKKSADSRGFDINLQNGDF